MENENLDNKPSVKKSNLRDYDKEPLIIKDELSNAKFTSIIITIILLISCIIYLLIFDRIYNIIIHVSEKGGNHVKFYRRYN